MDDGVSQFDFVSAFGLACAGCAIGIVMAAARAARRHGRVRWTRIISSRDTLFGTLAVVVASGVTGTVVARYLPDLLSSDPDPMFVAFVAGMFAHDRIYDLLRLALASDPTKEEPTLGTSERRGAFANFRRYLG
ncbi:MAG: hypothetical protein RID81_00430 [Sandaracinaceae bacterium]